MVQSSTLWRTAWMVVCLLPLAMPAACGGSTALPGDGAAGAGGADASADGAPDPLAQALRVSLAASWSFDGDGLDRSGQGLDLRTGTLPFVTAQFGKGASFSGDGTAIAERPISDPTLDLATGDFTVSFWLRFAKTGFPQFVAVKGYADGGWFVGWAQTVWAFGLPAPAMGGMFADPAGSPSTAVFHHVVFLRAGDTAQIFVDGASVGMAAVTDSPPPGPASFQVGGYSPGRGAAAQSTVHGVVDELAIWHRALTEAERAYLGTHPAPTAGL